MIPKKNQSKQFFLAFHKKLKHKKKDYAIVIAKYFRFLMVILTGTKEARKSLELRELSIICVFLQCI